MLVVVIVDYRGGWTENVLRDALFSLLGTNQNVLWDTNDFNIDSLMGTKKMSTVFRNSCLSQSGVIVDAKVSDRQRRCWAPCRNVIGYKSSFTCHVLLGSCLLSCWVLFKELQGEISLFLIMILCYLAPATRYSSQFTFHVFFPKAVFGFTQALRRIFRRIEMGFLPHLIVEWSVQQFRNTNGFVSAVWWILSFGTQIRNRKCPSRRTILRNGCLQYYLNVQKT